MGFENDVNVVVFRRLQNFNQAFDEAVFGLRFVVVAVWEPIATRIQTGGAHARFADSEFDRHPDQIARTFHTLVIDHVPVMGWDQRNAAKRFITLIDTLYDTNVKLVASADAAPTELYAADQGVEVHEFKRTASRLIEMGSEQYLALPHGRRESVADVSPSEMLASPPVIAISTIPAESLPLNVMFPTFARAVAGFGAGVLRVGAGEACADTCA